MNAALGRVLGQNSYGREQLSSNSMTYYEVGESGVSCNRFYSNHCNVKSVEYLKFLFISLDSPLVALEREISN